MITAVSSSRGTNIVFQLFAGVDGQSASLEPVSVEPLDGLQRVRGHLEVDEAVAADDGNVQNIAAAGEQLSQVGGVSTARNVVHKHRKHF